MHCMKIVELIHSYNGLLLQPDPQRSGRCVPISHVPAFSWVFLAVGVFFPFKKKVVIA